MSPPPSLTRRYGALADQYIETWPAARGEPQRPLLVLIHGGFWRPQYDLTHMAPMARALAGAGWPVASLEYRRIPGHAEHTLGDVVTAFASAREWGRDRPPIVAGFSAGGHLALWLAATARTGDVGGVLALAPAADLALLERLGTGDGAVAAFLGGDPARRAALDPALLPDPSSPVTIVHGEEDAIVPLAASESYRVQHPRTRLCRIAGAGHFDLIDPDGACWPLVSAELERLAG